MGFGFNHCFFGVCLKLNNVQNYLLLLFGCIRVFSRWFTKTGAKVVHSILPQKQQISFPEAIGYL